MKAKILILSLLTFFIACKNSDKKQTSTNDSDSVSVVTTEDNNESQDKQPFKVIQFDGTPTFNDFLSFFPVVDTGNFKVCSYGDSVLPEKFNKLTGFDINKDSSFISPLFKKKINNFSLVLFTLVCPDSVIGDYLVTYDKSGNFIDTVFFEPTTDGEIYDYHLSEDNNFTLEWYWVGQGEYETYDETNHLVIQMPINTEGYMDMESYFITNTGKIVHLDNFVPLKIVTNFINYLGNRELEKAFKLQKVKKWGDYEQFSSPQAFGGINKTKINKTDVKSFDNNIAKIYCETVFYDSINGNDSINQIFTVQKIDTNYYITDMKVVSFKQLEVENNEQSIYYNKDKQIQDASFDLSNITNTGFKFHLLLVSDNYDEDADGYPYAELGDSATYVEPNHAVFSDGNCKIDFYFKGDTIKIVENGKCDKYRNEKVSFNSIFYKSK